MTSDGHNITPRHTAEQHHDRAQAKTGTEYPSIGTMRGLSRN